MTETDIIDGILDREGGWREAVKRPDDSWDPATNKGITFPMLEVWCAKTGRPAPFLNDLRTLTDERAALIYYDLFIDRPGFTAANIPFEPLRVQLIDFGVNSGQARAVRWLQRVLAPSVEGHLDVTGTIDTPTRALLASLCRQSLGAVINDALVAARCRMIIQAVAAGHIAKSDEHGLLLRALSFTLTRS